MRQALHIADRVYVMQRGRIVMSGTGDEVHGRIDEIEATYLSGPRGGRGRERAQGGTVAADSNAADRRRIVVVTGGGAGIGAAIAEEIGRSGAFVVTVDPGVTVDGLARSEGPRRRPPSGSSPPGARHGRRTSR